MKTVTICGSMKFQQEMKVISWTLESDYGFNVLQCVYNENNNLITEYQLKNMKQAHFLKIDLSESIYVIDMNDYIGESVQEEIIYAQSKGKEILYHSTFLDIGKQ